MRLQFTALVFLLLTMTACAGNPNSAIALRCERGLKNAYHELDLAKTKGFSATVEYTKAASLLGAAKVQYEFGKYPNCVNKVERARAYIQRSQR